MNLPPGFTSRPATLEDLDDVATLVRAWDLKYVGESEAARAMLQYEWGAASFDMERDTRVIHAADGALAAFAQHSTPDPGLLRYDAFGPVDPRSKGGGSDRPSSTGRRRRRAPGSGRAQRRDCGTRYRPATMARSRCSRRTVTHPSARSGRCPWIWTARSMPAPVPEGVTIRPVVMEMDGPAAQSVLNMAFRIALRPCGGDVREVAGAAGGRRHLGSHARTARRGRRGRSSATATTG